MVVNPREDVIVTGFGSASKCLAIVKARDCVPHTTILIHDEKKDNKINNLCVYSSIMFGVSLYVLLNICLIRQKQRQQDMYQLPVGHIALAKVHVQVFSILHGHT